MVFLLCALPYSVSWSETGEENPLEALTVLHVEKTPPGPYDWLAQHHEPGQTFDEYFESNPVIPDAWRRTIYITLLGDFDKTREEVILKTARYLEAYFQLPVKFTPPVVLKAVPAHARRFHPTGTGFSLAEQVLTTYLIEDILKPRVPEDAFCLIAFTTADLWPGEGWNFVFGQASLTDRVGVWSIFRNGDPSQGDDAYQLCLRRTIQTGAHEIGHMFSLYHCVYFECLMNGSNHRQEADSRPLWLCPVCLRKLLWALKVDPIKRYRDLVQANRELGFVREAEYYEAAIKILKKKGSRHE